MLNNFCLSQTLFTELLGYAIEYLTNKNTVMKESNFLAEKLFRLVEISFYKFT